MSYTKDGKQIGIVVDLANAIKNRLNHAVRIDYMNWSKAQQMVLEGAADALLQINTSEERENIYDFSGPLLESEFSIFIKSDMEDIYDVNSLKGLQVGVEEMGLPIQILKRHPLIHVVVIPDIISGFHLLADRKIDAVVVDRWVGSFVVAENNLRGIRISGEPIEKSSSAIAVRKGNPILLDGINHALDEIRKDGTYARILAKWEPEEIIFQTKDQYFRQKVISVALLSVLFIMTIAGVFLIIEVKKRRQSEKKLFKYQHHLEDLVKERTSELQSERQRLADILYGTNTGTWEWNVQTGETIFNERWANIIGYTLHELEPISIQTWIEFTHPDDLKVSNELLEKHFKREINYYEFECRMKHKNGSWVWVLDRGRVISWTEDNKPFTVSGTHQDITGRKQTEAELMESEQRLSLALKANQDAVWDWDLLTNNLYYSPHWWTLIGYEPNELKADPDLWRRLMHPGDLEQANFIVENAIIRETSFEVESRLLHKEGHYVPILTRGFVLRDKMDKAVRISGTNADLTERKKIEEERRYVEQQLQQIQKAESLSRMAGAIAHNFNNQLSVVQGNLELALDDLPGDTNIHEFLYQAMMAAQRSTEISGLMLTYLGQVTIKLEILNLSEICYHDLQFFQDTIPKNITLETDFMVPGPVVEANANQVRIVLTHLITNGAESIGDRNGEIALEIKTIPKSDIPKINISPIDWQPGADIFACLEVRDTGCGISDQDIEKIFDPFFTTKFTGRGLGLSVVLGIVKTWKGAVSAESRKGHGSTFRIFLPLSTDETPQAG